MIVRGLGRRAGLGVAPKYTARPPPSIRDTTAVQRVMFNVGIMPDFPFGTDKMPEGVEPLFLFGYGVPPHVS
jgi:hypothetical protein